MKPNLAVFFHRTIVQAAAETENKQQAPTPPAPAPVPAAELPKGSPDDLRSSEEGMGLGGEPPQEKAKVDPHQQELNKLGFAQ